MVKGITMLIVLYLEAVLPTCGSISWLNCHEIGKVGNTVGLDFMLLLMVQNYFYSLNCTLYHYLDFY